jgi:DNA-directed RNA polymerase specialized sigma24 family protein
VSDQQSEFADFFRASWEPCLRAVVAVAGSSQLAEDQVAEAFARAWLAWPRVRRHPAPRAWVVRTALNAGASWWRRRGRDLPLAGHDLTAPGDPGGGLDAALLTAIWRLPSRQREVIALRIFLDLDTASIARQLQCISWRLPSTGSEIQAISPSRVQATCTFIPVVLCFPE